MLVRYLVIALVMATSGTTTEIHTREVSPQRSDSSWNRIKLSCGGERKRAFIKKELAPRIPASEYAAIDSLGVITVEQLLGDTLSLTIKKYTAWEPNTATNSLERKILTIDSVLEKIRWECQYVGPGKGNCSSCQVTDCNGQPLGPLKTGQPLPRN